MKRNCLILFFLFCISCNTLAQEKLKIKRSELKTSMKWNKRIWKSIQTGEKYFESGEEFYALALMSYLKASKFSQYNAKLNYKIGICFLYNTPRSRAIDYLKKAYAIDTLVADDIHYQLGRAYHLNFNFKEAIAEYHQYFRSLTPDAKKDFEQVIAKRIEECNNGIELIKKPVRAFVENMGQEINSPYPERFPLINSEQTRLIFTSKRENLSGGDQEINQKYSDEIFFSSLSDSSWKTSNRIKELNTSKDEQAIYITPDYQEIILKREKNIFSIKLEPKGWSAPVTDFLFDQINLPIYSLSLSFDKQTLYFTTERKGRAGGRRDIFTCENSRNGKHWDNIQSVGSIINTEFDDESPFICVDNKTLYFSSKGHNSMGGSDIFKSVFDPSTGWSKPENLGYPINTPSDETDFILSPDGRHAYYSSARDMGNGHSDIYKILLLGEEKPIMLSTEDNLIATFNQPVSEIFFGDETQISNENILILKGKTINLKSFLPLKATIEIYNLETGKLITSIKSNSQTGKFFIPLAKGTDYGLSVSSENFLFYSDRIDSTMQNFYKSEEMEIGLQPLKKGAKIVLKNIYFNESGTKLTPISFRELDKLIEMLKNYNTLKILVLVHFNSGKTLKMSAKTSDKQALIITNYCKSKGIDNKRLDYQGCASLGSNLKPEKAAISIVEILIQ